MSVRYGLLGLIGQHPRHGYELQAAFTAMVGGGDNWEVKPAQIYTTLSRLKEAGWIAEEGMEQDGGPEKRMFAITTDGQTALALWLEEPVTSTHRRDEFFIKLMIGLYTGDGRAMRIIYAQRRQLMQELHDITSQRIVLNPKKQLAHILLLDQAVMHTEADIRWLDMVEARIDDIRKQPLPAPEVKLRGRPKKTDI